MTWPLFGPQPAGGPRLRPRQVRPSMPSLGRSVVLTIRRLVASNPTASHRSAHPLIAATTQQRQHGALTISLATAYRGLPQESKGFLGICSIPCSRGHTASLPGDIAIEPDAPDRPTRNREQRGNRVRLIVPHLEHHPAIRHQLPRSAQPSGGRSVNRPRRRRAPGADRSSAPRGRARRSRL